MSSNRCAWLAQCCDEFHMELGIISHIKGLRYCVRHVYSAFDMLSVGDCFDLGVTYCEHVVKHQKTQAIAHVGGQTHFRLHPAYHAVHLESYIGTPLFALGHVIGTLNLSSFEVRNVEFSQNEMQRLEQLAQDYLARSTAYF